MRDNDVEVRAGTDIMDMSSPVKGMGGTMYRLTHHRAEASDDAFVFDVDESELVAAPDVSMLSGAKGGVLWLVSAIIFVDAMLLYDLPASFAVWPRMYISTLLTFLFLALSAVFCIGLVRSVIQGNRIEPIVFSRTARTVTHYGKNGVRTYSWERLHPFIRIVRVVGTAGGAQTYQLIFADVDPATGKIGSEFVAGKGDLIGSGVLRAGFFKAYMDYPLERMPPFRLVTAEPDWMQRMALSMWTFPGLSLRWTGEKPWSPLVALGSAVNTIVVMPMQMLELLAARITQGPYGERSIGPWMKRFSALPEASVLRTVAREHAGVVRSARQCLVVALAIGALAWSGVALFMCELAFG